jgi:hypothetical protein
MNMSIATWPPRIETTPVLALEDAVFDPQALKAALESALFQMLEGTNLVAPSVQAQETLIIVPDLSRSGIVLKEAMRRAGSKEAAITPSLVADQLGLALATEDPVEVSALWARRRISTWARALSGAVSLRAASALITGDVCAALTAAAAPAEKTRRCVSISTWLSRRRAQSNAEANSLPCLIGRLDAVNGSRLPAFSVETAQYRIPKRGEFFALNLAPFAPMGRFEPAVADVEIIERASRAAAAAFLAARYGARVGSTIPYRGRRVEGRHMDSWLDVLRFIVSASGITHALSIPPSDAQLRVVVDTDAGTMRLARIDVASAHERAALLRGIRRQTIVRDPADFMPREGALGLSHCIATAAMDALIENEERLAAESPRGWRARAFERALRTLAFRPVQGDGGLEGDWQGLRLLREHCRRTSKNVDDIIPRKAVSEAVRKVQAPGVHFSAELCAAADRRARLPADHPDRLWMVDRRRTGSEIRWHAVIGPDLKRVSMEWLQAALILGAAVEKVEGSGSEVMDEG